ncbi:2-succinyl-5-enolpyruvyl-6-hydroxy-3-cyclohexene-1-carboxylic-acid synthase [Kocuria sp. p3-SID1433]|uniref:2-succinyl-5-enolpyruvyl-6-hydroxy-3- cyclohexene-1-carboxylic-acid synthase n=1 Tax=unclassified Kocuria TaxID=2649579 RepID=UPI0021A3BB1C|nr:MULTISPECIES: 2-succinyl-5-enolpyruvyl-6-hydroxy-3-cyclohexene-1-carboxylic-acid synthase [unclassified Kocuria]MCT1602338.1 2-succinyl-5-enolpyruvyl-6-hydroxy-3-cyclohexene-1-carboxylic-acid synthase [Kocuria sp. p3-SID1428]MCT2180507.1 2-succinyl-5-enolpyruvyl-6-hydroxy-3-cyclohexene-1-carboxylic-acid synthase [Kocuria sp. p3-SID1433]
MTSDALLTAAAVLDGLVETGMRELFVCPGSRSAPFAYEAARRDGRDLSVHVRLDERSAAFHALGAARATSRPAAVVTTSGTAAGNLLPAVMEAHHGGVGLVAITADRPPELRGTGANQTTVQPGIFAGFVRAEVDVVLEASGQDPESLRRRVLAALAPALSALEADGLRGPPGPVHLNIALRDPLQPQPPTDSTGHGGGSEAAAGSAASGEGPADDADEGRAGPAGDALADRLRLAVETPLLDPSELQRLGHGARLHRSVVVAGDGAGAGAAQLAEALGTPLLAEPSSQARRGSTAIGPYRALLETPLGEGIERVLLVGRPTLSRPVAALLRRPGVEVAAWRPRPVPWFEDGRRPERELSAAAEAAEFLGRAPQQWSDDWSRAGAQGQRRALEVLHRAGSAGVGLPGPLAARAVWDACRADRRLLVMGSSNPIRDLDLLGEPDPRPEAGVEVLANRGLAGIDGLVATAAGAGLAAGRPVRALLGDLTLLHDAGSLLSLRGERAPQLQIVVLDDGGGGIFATLEHGALGEHEAYRDTVERFFGTPPSARIDEVCAGYGIPVRRVGGLRELEEALRDPDPGIGVVVVRAHRAGLRQMSQELTRAVRG